MSMCKSVDVLSSIKRRQLTFDEQSSLFPPQLRVLHHWKPQNNSDFTEVARFRPLHYSIILYCTRKGIKARNDKFWNPSRNRGLQYARVVVLRFYSLVVHDILCERGGKMSDNWQ